MRSKDIAAGAQRPTHRRNVIGRRVGWIAWLWTSQSGGSTRAGVTGFRLSARGKAQLRAFHEYRYGEGPYLLRSDRTRRNNARDAFHELATILYQTGMAASSEEAKQLSHTFTWMVNTHPEAEWRRLKLLASRLQQNLLSSIRQEDAVAAAKACIAFLSHDDLSTLENALSWM